MEQIIPIRPLAETAEVLYDMLSETSVSFESFQEFLSDLEHTNYIESSIDIQGEISYRARIGLAWPTICELADPIKKKILLQLIQNPKTFFVLFNTQKGKLRIAGQEMSKWSNDRTKRVVSMLIVDNDKTLAQQSSNGLFNCFELRENHASIEDLKDKYKVKIFELSSNNKTSLSEIITYIDAYAYMPDYEMPLIVYLANDTQILKLIKILYHIINHRNPNLAAGVIWDEADKTYPRFRMKQYAVGGGNSMCYLDFVNNRDRQIYRTGYVTATEGELLDEDYEECANAYHYPVVIDPQDEQDYIAFHHPDSIKHYIECRRDSNNIIAEKVLTNNWESHFNTPLTLRNGLHYHRKVIINSNAKGEDMKNFAKAMLRKGANAMTFNQHGVTLYSTVTPAGKKYSTKNWNFNRLLFYIYKKNLLENKPLIIIGRRKVDRGLGFHYAPRRTGTRITNILGQDGILITDGTEGLIWTDFILGGKIEDLATAVQKAGRGAGIIAQCIQYSGEFHYWLEEETSKMIERHYKKVDTANKQPGANTILQSVTRANEIILENEPPEIIRNHNVDPNTYTVVRGNAPGHTLNIVKDIVNNIFKQNYRTPTIKEEDAGFYPTSLNDTRSVAKLIDAVKKVPGAYGTNHGEKTYRRFYPCYSNFADNSSLYCVIPLIDPSYSEEMKVLVREKYSHFIYDVPQVGNIDNL